VFYVDIAKVDRDVAYIISVSESCCKCFKGMFQAFVQNISYILDVCCKRFRFGCCICFTHICRKSMFKMFQPFSVLCWNKCFYVACCTCFVACCMFHKHVPNVCFKCFICFRCMLLLNVSYFRGRELWGTP
jgi:hypothetical protein